MALKVSLELKVSSGAYSPRTELVDSFGGNELKAINDKYAKEGELYSWVVKEQLPYDEGYQAAMAGDDCDKNPYAEHFWKHNEWCLGHDSFHESY